MNLSPVKVVRENTGGLRKRPATRPGTISGTGINRSSGRAANDPRATLRGGRRLSEPVGAGGELALRVLLRELVEAQIRRVCRKKYNFDWSAFVEGGGDRLMTGILRFRAVREGRRRGLDLRLTDIAIGTVVEVVGEVIAEWTDQPGLRPTYAKFCEEQGRRGEQGRVTQSEKALGNAARVMALVANGETSDTVIASRLDLDRSTVWRIRRKAEASVVVLQETADVPESPTFPDPEIPPAERWPVVQFIRRTGAALGAGDARYLADVGRCYEAEGRTDELVRAIGRSAGAEVRDPWMYLQQCITQRGDAWTVTAQLLGDVLTWAGKQKLEYSLLAIGGGQIERPLPYLRRVVATAVGEGNGKSAVVDRPLVMAVAMSAQLAPALLVEGADDALAAEAEQARTGHVKSYRRRHGRLPWEDQEEGSACCIGLNGFRDESLNPLSRNIDSSWESGKADATPAMDRREVSASRGAEKLEQRENAGEGGESGGDRCAESHGEAGKQALGGVSAVPRQNGVEVLEHGPCRHPVVVLLTARMVLDDIAEVECSAGCGHWLYSDRGPVECPCHWPAARTARLSLAFARAIA